MKKILFVFALLMGLASVPANAKTAPVQILQDFSIKQPSQTLLVKVLANVQLSNGTMLHEGYYVLGQIMDASNSGFVFMPVKYQNFHNEVFEVNGNFPAKFVEVIEQAAKNNDGIIAKNSKILLDFIDIQQKQDNSIGVKYQNAGTPEDGISAIVNKTESVIYDDTIPQTMKDFPGIKLNSFDNSSNFNIPRKLMIEAEMKDSNINSLKY